jgi:hypothetical protein
MASKDYEDWQRKKQEERDAAREKKFDREAAEQREGWAQDKQQDNDFARLLRGVEKMSPDDWKKASKKIKRKRGLTGGQRRKLDKAGKKVPGCALILFAVLGGSGTLTALATAKGWI